MSKKSYIVLIAILFKFVPCNGQTVNLKQTQMDSYELSPETAHVNAKQLLVEEFYWSGIEESGPFGNDDGSDAFYSFRQWRQVNKQTSPVAFLSGLISSWEYPPFNWNEMDNDKIEKYITQQSSPALPKEEFEAMKEHMKSEAKKAGKEFDEKQFNELFASVSGNMGSRYLLGMDNAIIAVGFGQFVLEGKIDRDLKTLTKTAIQRQLLPILINRWDSGYQSIRIEQLNKMMNSVETMILSK